MSGGHVRVAAKKIFDARITEELLEEFDNEVNMLARLRHPNIIAIYAVHRKQPLCVLTELVEGGTLFSLLHQPRRFRPPNVMPTSKDRKDSLLCSLLTDTASALTYTHHMGICHRDIKSHNVLIRADSAGRNLTAKLCDFGLARMKSKLCTGDTQWAGTPNYLAPEVFRKQVYSHKIDVFAFGVLSWETLTETVPFDGLDPQDIFAQWETCHGQGRTPLQPNGFSDDLKAALPPCWAYSPAERPEMADILTVLVNALRG